MNIKDGTLHLIAIVALSVFIVSCSKSKEQTIQYKSSNSSEPAIELKAKWTPGKKVVQRLTMSSSIEFSGGSGKQNRSVQQVTDLSWDYSLNTVKQLDNGGHEVELEFVSTKMDSKAGDRIYMSFDSAHDSGQEAKDPFTPALRKLVGAKVQYILGADNKVERVDGYDDFMVRIARGSKNSEMLKGMFSQEMLKRLGNWNEALPDHPVRPGDSWKRSMNMNLYGTVSMTIDGTFTFKSWEDHDGHKCVKLDYDGTISGANSGSARVKIEKGKIHGSSWFDPKLGILVASDSDQTMTVGFEQRDKSMSREVRQNVTVQLLE